MDDLITEFLTETNESISEIDSDLVRLEQNPNDKDLLSKIFRLMHTVKGTCGFLGLPRLEKVAHHAENVLGLFRDGVLNVTPSYVTLIFESIDRIKYLLGELEANSKEPEGNDSDLISRLDAVYEGYASGGTSAPSEPTPAPSMAEAPPAEEPSFPVAAELLMEFENISAVTQEKPAAPAPVIEPSLPAPAADLVKAPAAATAPHDDENKQQVRESAVSAQSLRVNVDVLENLMTMVSELVLTRNQLLQILRSQKDSEFTSPLQRLNHVVSDLQEGVMKTRMQPIGSAWSKLPRIIRDLSMELGKKIDLRMEGQDTELDRQVLELIKDPLTHMVRNSADHGIEKPADRARAGKPETGTIILNAFHEGGHIIIEISDDGKGLPIDLIRKKILQNGLATEAELEAMSHQQIYQFIFKAGFSTAEKVTAVSGRGVGMDVVRTNIESIGGSIELKSIEGKGSTFTIKIPLTLAIVSALIVEASGERFAIPQLAVRELVMTSDNGQSRIEKIKGTPVFRLRDHLLPLVSLQDILKLHRNVANDMPALSQNSYIVVAQVGPYQFGIIVDRVYDTEEIVVKPVAKILKNIDLFSGNTILGDGSVIMILDPAGIAKSTGKIDPSENKTVETAEETDRSRDKTSLLLFGAGQGAPKAVPLSLVARLENVKMADIETSNGHMLIQYRGTLMPLVPFDNTVRTEGFTEKPVLVFGDEKRSMGLIVDEIIDIVEEYIDVQITGDASGLLGSSIIGGKATDILDVGHFLGKVSKTWFKDHGDDPFESNRGTKGRRRVLLVDDSPFFRNMLTPLLTVAGYDVTATDGPVEALKICEKGERFDIIVSDIEMPQMTGFEFAVHIKQHTEWQDIPLVALSSHATPQDIERGRAVGFDRYIAKFDRDTLLNTLSQTLAEQDRLNKGDAA